MPDWSTLTPPSPVREIEQHRKRVLELRQQVPKRIEQRDHAAARVVELERDDRQRMAEMMARGKEAISDVEQIERGRAGAAGAVRATEALSLAIQTAENQLHEVVLKHRARWSERAARDVAETRAEARDALAAFRTALQRSRDAEMVAGWLLHDSGLDRERRAKTGVLGFAPGSDHVTGNRQEVDLGTVFTWLEDALAEPRPKQLPRVQPLQPIG